MVKPGKIEVARLRLPGRGAAVAAMPPLRPPRHRPGENFLKGPLSWAWLCRAGRLPGRALHVAILLCFWSALSRLSVIKFSRKKREALGKLSKGVAGRGLEALETDGLVRVARLVGRAPSVELLGAPGDIPAKALFLAGPIPWAWLRHAAQAPGRALHVALALWFTAGQTKARRFEFSVANLAELGLDRYAAYRGLAALQTANLIRVPPHIGRNPIVELLDVPAGTGERA